MEIILSRHGNTFDPHDPVVWAGSSNNIPLVKKGIEQAEKLAYALINQNIELEYIYCGPLQRTHSYAQIVCQLLKFSINPIVDPRLNEIDYGEWTGLTNEEVVGRFGKDQLKAWDEKCVWPTRGNWRGSEAQVTSEVESFIDEVVKKHGPNKKILVITSNGRLRYFLKTIRSEFEKRIRDGSFKVKTGHICKLVCTDRERHISYWNSDPSQVQL